MKILKCTLWLFALFSLLACPTCQLVGQETDEDAKLAEAAEVDKEAEEEVAEDTVESIGAEWQKLSVEYSTKMRAASAEEREAIAAEMPKINDYVDRMMALANNDITSDDGKSALMWIIRNDRSGAGDNATDLMIEHHSEAPEMAAVILGKTREIPTEASLALLDKLVANGKSKRVQGAALYVRALQLKQGFSMWNRYEGMLAKAEVLTEDEVEEAHRGMTLDQVRAMVAKFKESIPESVREMYADESLFNTEIEAAFVKVVDDFGNVKLGEAEDSPTIGDRVESELFEIRYLAVGREAPEIEGEDVDGVSFKLSDYRGKVVVIDFWGDW